MAQLVKRVKVTPNTKIKVEIPSDDEETSVSCRLCNKYFANEKALRNHASMEHIDAFVTGDPEVWMMKSQSKKEVIQKKTAEILSSMAPTNLATLASDEVDYIIVKAEDVPPSTARKRKERTPRPPADKQPKSPRKEKVREVQPITGPFECLQPSSTIASGTCHQIFFSCCEYSIHFRDEHTRRRKGLRCQVCEKPLAGSEGHMPNECEVCGAGFQTNKELSNHVAIEHVKLKPFECSICHKRFTQQVCGAGFQTNKELSNHVAIEHVKLKPFESSICHKRFTQQGGVQQHMRMHTGDRPFPCTFCPKAFTQKSGLEQHLRIHTKIRPYRCVICSKTFCQSVHLRQHMRTHTNVSPFQCGICQKRFKQSSHLNYHLKNHNQKDMSDEQKDLYKKLVMMMNSEKNRDFNISSLSVIEGEDGTVSIQEVPHQQGVVLVEEDAEADGEEEGVEYEEVAEGEDDEVEYEQETVESEVLFDEDEQYIAEQSIKQEPQTQYIISDIIYEK